MYPTVIRFRLGRNLCQFSAAACNDALVSIYWHYMQTFPVSSHHDSAFTTIGRTIISAAWYLSCFVRFMGHLDMLIVIRLTRQSSLFADVKLNYQSRVGLQARATSNIACVFRQRSCYFSLTQTRHNPP